MNGRPSAAQKRWHDWCREYGCVICRSPAEIHHIEGARAKRKGMPGWGEWYILPLCPHHHRIGPDALHENRRAWEKRHGTQAFFFSIIAELSELVPGEILEAVQHEAAFTADDVYEFLPW